MYYLENNFYNLVVELMFRYHFQTITQKKNKFLGDFCVWKFCGNFFV